MAKTYVDAFTRSGTLAASTSSDGLFTWALVDASGTVAVTGTNIDANTATGGPSFGTSAECDTDAVYTEIQYVSISSGGPSFWMDVGANGTYPAGTGYEASIDGGANTAKIFAVAGGSFTQIASVSHTPSAGVYRLERNGSSIILKKDGVTLTSATDSSEPTGSGKRKALFGVFDNVGVHPTFDNFGYGDLGGGGTDPMLVGAMCL